MPRRPMPSRYQQIFLGHLYSYNKFGHKALNCKAYGKVRDYKKNFSKTKSSDQKDQKEFFGYFHCCHKFGHKATDCRTKGKDKSLRRKQNINTSNDRIYIGNVPHGNTWRRKSGYKDSEETQNSNISEVSKYDDEHNSAINISGIHYEGKKDEDDEEEYNGGFLFLKKFS